MARLPQLTRGGVALEYLACRLRQGQALDSDCHHTVARGGQVRHLRPAVVDKQVLLFVRADLRRAETPTVVPPAEDVELATHRCGGVTVPNGAHACIW